MRNQQYVDPMYQQTPPYGYQQPYYNQQPYGYQQYQQPYGNQRLNRQQYGYQQPFGNNMAYGTRPTSDEFNIVKVITRLAILAIVGLFIFNTVSHLKGIMSNWKLITDSSASSQALLDWNSTIAKVSGHEMSAATRRKIDSANRQMKFAQGAKSWANKSSNSIFGGFGAFVGNTVSGFAIAKASKSCDEAKTAISTDMTLQKSLASGALKKVGLSPKIILIAVAVIILIIVLLKLKKRKGISKAQPLPAKGKKEPAPASVTADAKVRNEMDALLNTYQTNKNVIDEVEKEVPH